MVVAIAAIGIGASTTVFSICQALLLRPLPFHDPDRLAWIANGQNENLSAQSTQVNNMLELRSQSRSFTDIAGYYQFYAPGDVHLSGSGTPERLTGAEIPVAPTGATEDVRTGPGLARGALCSASHSGGAAPGLHRLPIPIHGPFVSLTLVGRFPMCNSGSGAHQTRNSV